MSQKEQFSVRKFERGYIVIAGIFAVLLTTVIYSFIFIGQVKKTNEEIAEKNYELSLKGGYTIPQITVDYSIFNWAITAESAAFSIASAAQANKKKSNNNYEYMQLWMDKWFSDPDIRPYATQIMQTWLSTNQNNT